ncbi:branched-chain amino acid aminotransferase II [Cubamyces sp. BRFM 1775]|nr:branched-chain amino acid aminotransferase II [Cubamyces sp. BRFM 1775]
MSTQPERAGLEASRLITVLANELKPVPPPHELRFGQSMTDHMLFASHDPVTGWSAPEIKPYGPFTLEPNSSCFQYGTSAFEGMKAYVGPDGEPRLFRPEMNIARLARSAARLSLPPFNPDELLKLIKALVLIEKRWIPDGKGHSLYIRPMIVGTRPSIGLVTSHTALLWVMCAPTGPYLKGGSQALSLLAMRDTVRAWPGGTGEYKVASNYGPTIGPVQAAIDQGYDQTLWLLGDRITEAGVMNVFVVLKRDDGVDLLTPPLDGTILPGVTRDSILALAAAHPARMTLPELAPEMLLHPSERTFTMQDLQAWVAEGRLLEMFSVGTAVVVQPIGNIGYEGKDIALPTFEGGRGPIGKALYERLTDIQDGRFEWAGWSVRCED